MGTMAMVMPRRAGKRSLDGPPEDTVVESWLLKEEADMRFRQNIQNFWVCKVVDGGQTTLWFTQVWTTVGVKKGEESTMQNQGFNFYLFMAAACGLFSSCGERELHPSVVHGHLMVATSLVAACGLYGVGSIVVEHGLSCAARNKWQQSSLHEGWHAQ